MRYQLYETDKAEKSRKKLERGGRHIKEAIEKTYEQLSEDPFYGTTFLKGPLRGKRKKKFMRKLRIEFAICEECRRFGHKDLNKCVDCEYMPDNSVKIFDIFYREKGY
ncbi:MAG: hypothetical protein MOIL_01521 [Candidatus Methanolliviera sp. GoM_oil]|nr:MAG: hypothetical protein MOIL_01521 [Candidatus Methanolliviera sp. GoM_oil]